MLSSALALVALLSLPTAFELEEATVAQLQDQMASGKLTARKIAELYLARIEAIDRAGPALHAVIELNPDALAIADALDRERKEKGARGPLHGIPILLKDNIDTADKMATSAGSLALAQSIAKQDAFIVDRLRRAGAVILGKTNLSEWANMRSMRSTSGWSARGGVVKNPYALDRNACGSSSGTGAAISANLAVIGVGTETDGSIVCPSSMTGLVGIKPTVGLLSRSGIIPISHTQDTPGPMARTVTDAALLLAAMESNESDARDPATSAGAKHFAGDYSKLLDKGALKGARIGVARKSFFGYSAATDAVIEKAIAAMRDAGAVIVDPADHPTIAKLDACELEILLFELHADLDAYLAPLPPTAPVHSLADVIAFNDREKTRELSYFGQELLIKAQAKGPLSSAEYKKVLSACRTLSRDQGLDKVMKQHQLDAIVVPTTAPAFLTDLVNGDHFLGGSSTMAAVAGYPTITVPAGTAYGLPIGLSFVGKAWSEGRLIALAFAFEQATKARHAPQLRSTTSFSD